MLDTITNIASGIADFARSLTDFASGLNDSHTWLRVVLVILGGLLILAVLLKTAGRV